MRVVFMGTPDFAAAALAALIAAGHEIAAVYSQPPRPAGRGQDLRKSPVQQLAERHGLPVRHPVSLKSPDAQAEFAALNADIAVVAAYGLILPKAVLAAPRLGCLNIHASLLPRWRGAAPIQRAILAGDAETGITIMQMDEGLDTGAMLVKESVAIGPEMNAGALHDALAGLGARLIVETLAAPLPVAVPQPAAGVTYAAKISPAEAQIDWSKPAADTLRQIRAFAPVPGAWCMMEDGARLKVLAGEIVQKSGTAGLALDDALTVGCGEGALRLTLLQKAGKKAMNAGDFLRGQKVPAGTRFFA
ncbi:methionyl-tRNA formyltransferase [Dongia rigui]|uniref:Methionyl-tRNA formyltransferase n=1 Tax=Dongia rigui TaxID=940149 RepID=A0ABU5DZW2_9PROT|nr:methionyl-tRNA formyltransferase [Dongia rigui]MDY0872465.1 methionyl-tRNA formyltransferase [Dongia rigui]